MEMGCTGVSLVTLPRDYDDTMGKEGGRRQPGQANPKQKNKKQEAEEGQEEKAEAKEGERKKKEREEESILILIFPFFLSIGGYRFLIKSWNAIFSWVPWRPSQNIGWGGKF